MPGHPYPCAEACSAATATWASWAMSARCSPAPSADLSRLWTAKAGSKYPALMRAHPCFSPLSRVLPAILSPSQRFLPPGIVRASAALDTSAQGLKKPFASPFPGPPSSPFQTRTCQTANPRLHRAQQHRLSRRAARRSPPCAARQFRPTRPRLPRR